MKAAVVQLRSVADLGHNLERALHWIAEAAGSGASVIALPENFAYLGEVDSGPCPVAEPIHGPIVSQLQQAARQHGVVLVGATIPEHDESTSRNYNTAVVIDADGELRGHYRKMHLFDADLPDATYRESASVAAGDEIALVEVGPLRIGLSICYDLRFPELYRALRARGANILIVPAAFTVPSGRDHWEVLLRARAIENQCFVLAPGQQGRHGETRVSYGHSMIVDPWGEVLSVLEDGEGYVSADLDFEAQVALRTRVPVHEHRRTELT